MLHKALQKFHNTLSSNLQYYVITDVLWTPAFVMRKKGSYRKNKRFCLLAVAALPFAQA